MLLCSTVKPLRVSLVEPVAYLKDSYEICLELIGLVYPIMVMVSLLVMGKVRKID